MTAANIREKQRLKDHPRYEELMREHVHLWETLEDGKSHCMLCDGNRDGYLPANEKPSKK